MTERFLGYRRSDGTFGIRNRVLLLSTMDNVNPVVRAASDLVPDTVAFTPEFGRGHIAQDKELRRRTLKGYCSNANVGAVVVVSLEPEEARPYSEAARSAGRVNETIVLADCQGVIDAIARTASAAARLKRQISRHPKSSGGVADLIVGLECGGSDGSSGMAANPAVGLVADRLIEAGATVVFTETTEAIGTELILAERAISSDAADSITAAILRVEALGRDSGGFLGANPVPDNLFGGLTTIEEKSLGAIAKAGDSPISGFLDSGARVPGPGLYFMDSTPPAMESMSALVAAGCTALLFTTGQGNPSANPVAVTLKISANPTTCRRMPDAIDIDLSWLYERGGTLEEAAAQVHAELLAVARGALTWTEATGYVDASVSRLGPSL